MRVGDEAPGSAAQAEQILINNSYGHPKYPYNGTYYTLSSPIVLCFKYNFSFTVTLAVRSSILWVTQEAQRG